jgi:hypothetical protein
MLTLASSLNAPQSIGVDTTHVYYGTYGSGQLARIAKTGGSPEPLYAGGPIVTLVVDACCVYFTDKGTSPSFTDGRVLKLAK